MNTARPRFLRHLAPLLAAAALVIFALPLAAAVLGNEFPVTVTPPAGGVIRHAPQAVWLDGGPMLFWSELRSSSLDYYPSQLPANGPVATSPIAEGQVSAVAGSPVRELAVAGRGNQAVAAWTLQYGNLFTSMVGADGHPLGQPVYLGQVSYGGGVKVSAGRDRYLVAWIDGAARPTIALLDATGAIVLPATIVSESQLVLTDIGHGPRMAVATSEDSFLLGWSTLACVGIPCSGPAEEVVAAIDRTGRITAPTKVGAGYESPALIWNGSSYGVLWWGADDVLYARRVATNGVAIDPAPVRIREHWSEVPVAAWDGTAYLVAHIGGTGGGGQPNLTLERLSRDLSTFSPLASVPGLDAGLARGEYGTSPGEYALAASQGRIILAYTLRNQIFFRLGQVPSPPRAHIARP